MATMRRHLEFRPLDFIYDPVYITTDKAEYTATASYGISCVSQYAVQPQYDTMFTDNEKYARNAVIFRSTILPRHVNVSWSAKKHRMRQDTRAGRQGRTAACRYFARPKVAELNPFVNSIHLTSPVKPDSAGHRDCQAESSDVVAPKPTKTPKKVRRAVQTDYRESEAQTHPWAPPKPQGLEKMPPEIVMSLDFEHWEAGYPVTQHELDMVERTRLRRTCEQALNSANVDLCSKYHLIKQVEIYEWIQREDEIKRIYKLREKLSRKQTHMFTYLNQMRMDRRLEEVKKRKTTEMEKKLGQIEKRRERELRKLAVKTNAMQITADDLSQTKVINPSCKKETSGTYRMTPMEIQKMLEQLDAGVVAQEEDVQVPTNPKPCSVCPRDRKWTSYKIEKMYEDLVAKWKSLTNKRGAAISVEQMEPSSERSQTSTHRTLDSDFLDLREEETYRNAVLLQKLIRGRHWKQQVIEGMSKTKPLMEEIKHTMVLTEEDVRDLEEKKKTWVKEKRAENAENRQRQMLDCVQEQLQGQTISSVLSFLSKELARLEDERRCHALSLLAETQREMREAMENGRRQKVAERRREFNEMFKQMVKIKQDTVDSYLESIVLDSVQCVAQDRAREFIVNKAKAIDLEALEAEEKPTDEAVVQDLLYNCAIPEVANIQTLIAEEDAKSRGQKGIIDLLQATELEPSTTKADDKEREEKEERQRELLDLQEKLMGVLFPVRTASEEVPPGDSTLLQGATSGILGSEEIQEVFDYEFEELSADVSTIADDIGKDMFEILFETTHRVFETVTQQIIEEIIRTLLSKPGAMDHPSGSDISWSPSDARMDLLRAVDSYGSTLSFSEDGQIPNSREDENAANEMEESDSHSNISQEFNSDFQ